MVFKSLRPFAMDESGLSIERVKSILTHSYRNASSGTIKPSTIIAWKLRIILQNTFERVISIRAVTGKNFLLIR